ncbi:MAG: hypothetical protein ACTSUV_02515 [Candidatus Ranarchaeia archaeon]
MDPLILTRIFRHGPIDYSFQWNLRNHLNEKKNQIGQILWNELKNIYKGEIPDFYFSKLSGFDRASTFKIKGFNRQEKEELESSLIERKLLEVYENHSLINNSKQTPDISHPSVLSKLLREDPNSIAIETPVWSTNYLITGHVDLLRINKDSLEVIDYKPKGDFFTSIPQISTYGLIIHENYKIPLEKIKCIAFNQKKAWVFPIMISKEIKKIVEEIEGN